MGNRESSLDDRIDGIRIDQVNVNDVRQLSDGRMLEHDKAARLIGTLATLL